MWPTKSIKSPDIWAGSSSNFSLSKPKSKPVLDVSKLTTSSINKFSPFLSWNSGIKAPVYTPNTLTADKFKKEDI